MARVGGGLAGGRGVAGLLPLPAVDEGDAQNAMMLLNDCNSKAGEINNQIKLISLTVLGAR